MKRQTFILLAGLVLSVSAVRAQGGRLSPDLTRAGANKDKIDVIVQFVSPPSQADLNGVGAVKLNLPAINGAVFSLNPNALQGLANNPRIRYVSPDRALNADLEYAQPTVNANLAYSNGWDGSNVGVAVIDSGVNDHPDFKDRDSCTTSRFVYKENFVAGRHQ